MQRGTRFLIHSATRTAERNEKTKKQIPFPRSAFRAALCERKRGTKFEELAGCKSTGRERGFGAQREHAWYCACSRWALGFSRSRRESGFSFLMLALLAPRESSFKRYTSERVKELLPRCKSSSSWVWRRESSCILEKSKKMRCRCLSRVGKTTAALQELLLLQVQAVLPWRERKLFPKPSSREKRESAVGKRSG